MEKLDLEMLYFHVIGQKWEGHSAKALEHGVRRVLKTVALSEESILKDRYVQGLTHKQIGEKWGFTRSNAGSRIKKALNRLRRPLIKQILFEESNSLYFGFDWEKYIIPTLASKVVQRFIEAEQADKATNFQTTADQLKVVASTVFSEQKVTLTAIAEHVNKMGCLGMDPLKAANLVLEEFYSE